MVVTPASSVEAVQLELCQLELKVQDILRGIKRAQASLAEAQQPCTKKARVDSDGEQLHQLEAEAKQHVMSLLPPLLRAACIKRVSATACRKGGKVQLVIGVDGEPRPGATAGDIADILVYENRLWPNNLTKDRRNNSVEAEGRLDVGASAVSGRGVMALVDLPAGTVFTMRGVVHLSDSGLSPEEKQWAVQFKHKSKSKFLVPDEPWRWVNSAKHPQFGGYMHVPNSHFWTRKNGTISVMTMTDVAAGEELLVGYDWSV